tara:strand:+ start:517 stop:909 length:393 start_codon:yes stop_codon:yes gene_type:complete
MNVLLARDKNMKTLEQKLRELVLFDGDSYAFIGAVFNQLDLPEEEFLNFMEEYTTDQLWDLYYKELLEAYSDLPEGTLEQQVDLITTLFSNCNMAFEIVPQAIDKFISKLDPESEIGKETEETEQIKTIH